MNRIDPMIKTALCATGLPYDVRKGGHHLKLFLDGKFVGILPTIGGRKDGDRRARLNLVSQIRRAALGTPSNRRHK